MDTSKQAVAIFDNLAHEYQEKFMNVDLYADSLNLFCENIPGKNADILEMGCGPGNVTKFLLKKRPDFKILATDLAPRMLRLAEKNNPTAKTQLLDCRNINALNKNFDGMMCAFVLPYISKKEAEKLIKDASRYLNDKGIFYLSTMEGDYSQSGIRKGSSGDEMFMYFHEADYLVDALLENHFKILNLERKTYKSGKDKVVDLILVAEKLNI